MKIVSKRGLSLSVPAPLRGLISELEKVIDREQVVLVGCNEVSELVVRTLKKVGIKSYAYSAFVNTVPGRRIAHTWVEVDGYVVETNAVQILDSKRSTATMVTLDWERLTKPSEREEHEEGKVLGLTKAGESYYNKLADELAASLLKSWW